MASTSTASALVHSPRWQQFYQLTKPRVVQLIVFCAAIGMALAVPGLPDLQQALTMLAAIAGIWLVAGAAAAFNCLIEDGIDARMKRTAWRATAKGELKGVRIDASLLMPADKEMLEDLIIAAFSDGKAKADRMAAEKMQSLTAGLPLPPGMKLPF